ncbi:MAG TPA: radical SAM protein [Opitutaceae bacterium]|nr:radical SAM protein [Opitutaceae bacterium]
MNADYLPSRYVEEAPLPDGRTLLANLLWRTFLEVSPQEAPAARAILRGDGAGAPEALRQRLVDARMLIAASVDEAGFMSRRYEQTRYATHVLGLTLAPTLDCNLACVYCYENKRPGRMSAETEQQVADYVRRMLPGRKSVAVTWHGGEPLLCRETILRLSRAFIAMSDHEGASYHAFMLTNGYLLTPPVVEELAALGHWRRVQVTIDGTAASHDAKRPAKGGGATFARISENLCHAATRLPMVVRGNVDLLNPAGCHALLEHLAALGLAGRIEVYFAPVHPFGQGCRDLADKAAVSVASNAQFAPIELELRQHACALGFSDRGYLARPWLQQCQATSTHSVVIEPDGSLQRCTLEMGEDDRRIGHVSRPIEVNSENVLRWLRFDPTRQPPCRECRVLPVCFGYCPHRHLSGAPEEFACAEIRYRLRESVVFEYAARHRPDLLAALGPARPAAAPACPPECGGAPWTNET